MFLVAYIFFVGFRMLMSTKEEEEEEERRNRWRKRRAKKSHAKEIRI